MGRIYFKELPLFHLYNGDLTGSQKLLMTLLLVLYALKDFLIKRLRSLLEHIT